MSDRTDRSDSFRTSAVLGTFPEKEALLGKILVQTEAFLPHTCITFVYWTAPLITGVVHLG